MMNWIYNLTLQAFHEQAFRARQNSFTVTEAGCFLLEVVALYYLTQHPAITAALFFLRIAVTRSSLLRITMKLFYFAFFVMYYQLNLTNLALLFNQTDLKATNFKELLQELKDILIRDLLKSNLDPDEVVSYFYRHHLRQEYRETFFSFLKTKIADSSPIDLNTTFMKNTLILLKAFKNKDPILCSEEKSIITCLGCKIDYQLELKMQAGTYYYVSPGPEEFKDALKKLNLFHNSFPNLGMDKTPYVEYLTSRQSRYGLNYLELSQKRLQQLITLILYFKDTSSLEESYKKIYHHKKAMWTYWQNFFAGNPTPNQVIAWLNFHIIVQSCNLNYDELISIHRENKTPRNFYITINYAQEISNLTVFFNFLKQHYSQKRILKLMLTDEGFLDLKDCITLAQQYGNINLTERLPKKPKSFRDINDFFQIYGKYKNESNQALPQKHIEHLHLKSFDAYLIKIPKTRKELILLGRKLSICVGSSDTYTLRVQTKESFILFLYVEDVPKYCVEICPKTLSIKQAKGAQNHSMDNDQLLKLKGFLNDNLEVDKMSQLLLFV